MSWFYCLWFFYSQKFFFICLKSYFLFERRERMNSWCQSRVSSSSVISLGGKNNDNYTRAEKCKPVKNTRSKWADLMDIRWKKNKGIKSIFLFTIRRHRSRGGRSSYWRVHIKKNSGNWKKKNSHNFLASQSVARENPLT